MGSTLWAEAWGDRHRAGTGKPETLGIEFQESWWLRWTVAKPKAQLQRGQLGRGTSEQHVGVAHGMECTGTAKGAADFFSSDGFADVVDNNQSCLGGIAQTKQSLAARSFLRILQTVAERGEIDGKWELHKFRKTFASMHHDAGVSLRTIQGWLGHSSLEVTQAYLKGQDAKSSMRRKPPTARLQLSLKCITKGNLEMSQSNHRSNQLLCYSRRALDLAGRCRKS